jgi:hypothetical protein
MPGTRRFGVVVVEYVAGKLCSGDGLTLVDAVRHWVGDIPGKRYEAMTRRNGADGRGAVLTRDFAEAIGENVVTGAAYGAAFGKRGNGRRFVGQVLCLLGLMRTCVLYHQGERENRRTIILFDGKTAPLVE